ncbi:MAG: glycosyltransferase [Patescibacteria group bacterium]
MLRIGIECESIEGKNPMWGVGRIIMKLLEELSRRPELEKDFCFVLYFKDTVPDFPFLNAPIFEKKMVPVPFFRNRLFPIYYLVLLPIKLWFAKLDVMFWPAYMLPIGTLTKSFALMTEDVYYEAFKGNASFQHRFFYGVFGTYSAKFATKLLAISETSKHNICQVYKVNPNRVVVNCLGIDFSKPTTYDLRPTTFPYVLYVGQAFPRRHLQETILAFEKVVTEHSNILQNIRMSELKLIAIGPDKYKTPTIKNLVSEVNSKLKREAIIHKDYVKDDELADLYAGASALVYVSDREAFGLPSMEALSFGVPPVIADNELGHELFGEYAFYAEGSDVGGITKAVRQALIDSEKIEKIKSDGPDFVKKYNWKSFTDKWLEIVRSLN